ncbi:unnamed protein product, partial [marine sediment metagenome]
MPLLFNWSIFLQNKNNKKQYKNKYALLKAILKIIYTIIQYLFCYKDIKNIVRNYKRYDILIIPVVNSISYRAISKSIIN